MSTYCPPCFKGTLRMTILAAIDKIQRALEFKIKHWEGNEQFTSEHGLGRVSLIACILSSILTAHGIVLIGVILHAAQIINLDIHENVHFSGNRIQMATQWLLFVITLCIFHLGEFFVTALYNPSVLSASSYVVNHSKPYTIAILASITEFSIRFIFFPSVSSKFLFVSGGLLVVLGQCIRSLAMITCGESFNHIIQHSKKKNHVLVQHGIYKYLRHPSYFGFFYWSIGTQLLLGNMISTVMFTIASWVFFQRRIPYEEATLLKIFPAEYAQYRTSTYIGIPFINTTKNNNTAPS